MNIEKVNELMNEVAEKLSRECKMSGAMPSGFYYWQRL